MSFNYFLLEDGMYITYHNSYVLVLILQTLPKGGLRRWFKDVDVNVYKFDIDSQFLEGIGQLPEPVCFHVRVSSGRKL